MDLKKERQVYLTTLISSCTTEQENIRKVLLEVKEGKSRKENIKSISKFTVGELRDICAFLHAKNMVDSTEEFLKEVKSFLKDGLVENVVRRIENLWPEPCRTCKNNTATSRVTTSSFGVSAAAGAPAETVIWWTPLCTTS